MLSEQTYRMNAEISMNATQKLLRVMTQVNFGVTLVLIAWLA